MLQCVSDSLPFKGWIILHWMYQPYSVYPSTCWETLEWLLPLDYCEWCCHEFGCTNTSVRPGFQFIRMHIPRSRIAGSYGSCIFNVKYYSVFIHLICGCSFIAGAARGYKKTKQNFLHACVNVGILTQDDSENFLTRLSQLRVALHEPWKPLMLGTGPALSGSNLSSPQQAYFA